MKGIHCQVGVSVETRNITIQNNGETQVRKYICSFCGKEVNKSYSGRVRKARKNHFCNQECHLAFKAKNKTTFTCANCGAFVSRPIDKQSKNSFCSSSCAATFNNTHKTKGTRRSKLEVFLESFLRERFPFLEIICNSKEAIGSELDFYFPQLRIAVELNGIFHYEPIYGTSKLEQIQNNDKQKSIRCFEKGIEFCTIDTSEVSHLTPSAKVKYSSILEDLILQNINRIEGQGRDLNPQ